MSDLWNSYPDVPGQCNAHCYIGDNYGDGSATMRCALEPNHEGCHKEIFRDGTCILTWEKDERCYHKSGYHYDDIDGVLYCETCYEKMSETNYTPDVAGINKFQLIQWDGNKFIIESECKLEILKNTELAPI